MVKTTELIDIVKRVKAVLCVNTLQELDKALTKIEAKSLEVGETRTAMISLEWNGLSFEGGKGFVSGKKGVKTGKTKATKQKEANEIKQQELARQKAEREAFANKSSSGSEEY